MISVCIATYNGEKYIRRQLESILPQLTESDEIIISDDGSTDNTVKIIKSLNDPRIILLLEQKFRSPIFNFENALIQAKGDFIFLSDQDDLWLPGKVETVTVLLRECDLVLSDGRVINAEENVIEESFFKLNHSGRGFWKNIWKNSYLGCCLAFRKQVLRKALPFPQDIPMHDWWIGVVAEAFFKIRFIKQPLIHYRRHGVNATPTGETSQYSYLKRLGFRFALLKGIIKVWSR